MNVFVPASQMLHYENICARRELELFAQQAQARSENRMAPDFSVQGKVASITRGTGEISGAFADGIAHHCDGFERADRIIWPQGVAFETLDATKTIVWGLPFLSTPASALIESVTTPIDGWHALCTM